MVTKFKPIALSGKMLREMMARNKREGSFALIRTAQAIEEMSRLHDALDSLHRTPNPSMTKEGRALRYRTQFIRAMDASRTSALAAIEALNQREAEIKREAEIRAGLHSHVDAATAAEIRTALRAMSQEERDRAVREAAQAGDSTIIQAIRTAASPLLVGHIGVPMESILAAMVSKAAPELLEELEDVTTAIDLLNGAVNAFAREAESRRDPQLEAMADAQDAATKAADALIDAAAAGSLTAA